MNYRTLRTGKVDGYNCELSEQTDTLGDPIAFYITLEILDGQHETISMYKEYKEAAKAFNRMTEEVKGASAEKRRILAHKITDTVFYIDPYNGADEEDVTAHNLCDLRTLSGCYELIDQLCDMLRELNDCLYSSD